MPDGAICDLCGGNMRKVAGCDPHGVRLHSGHDIHVAIPYNSKREWDCYRATGMAEDMIEMLSNGGVLPCHDCGAMPGTYHHPGCDLERCPVCRLQRMCCHCGPTVKITEGTRVRLVRCSDEHTKLEPGELGTIRHIDALGTVHVSWDSGAQLGLIGLEDEYEVVT